MCRVFDTCFDVFPLRLPGERIRCVSFSLAAIEAKFFVSRTRLGFRFGGPQYLRCAYVNKQDMSPVSFKLLIKEKFESFLCFIVAVLMFCWTDWTTGS